MPNPPALLVTRDDVLLDELLRLAAAAGVTPEVAGEPGAALRSWSSAPLVLVGHDLAGQVARLGPPRRSGVHLVTWGEAGDDQLRPALAMGAEGVVSLTSEGSWLSEALTDLADDRRPRGCVLGVVGGSGGAGASTFAAALAQVAARAGPAVLVDADPLGPGADRLLGLEARAGVRWEDLVGNQGRLGGRSLRQALPQRDGLAALSWSGTRRSAVPAAAAREVLSAACRGHDVVVLDLPRGGDDVTEELAVRCDLVVVLAVPQVPAVAAAGRVCAAYSGAVPLGLVVRGRGVPDSEIAAALRLPVLAAMADQRGLAEAVDLGLGPVRSRRGPLGRAAAAVLAGVPGSPG